MWMVVGEPGRRLVDVEAVGEQVLEKVMYLW